MDEDISSALVVILFGLGGIITAGLEETLYNRGVMIDEFISGTISIADLMAITILIWILLGIVIAVIKR